ncbi:MAG: 50S ribosomal protein L5 [Candidatus Micrarchaeia archaeon]
MEKANPMQSIRLEKVTLNIGIGASEDKYDGAKEILQRLTGHVPAPAKSKSRRPEFGIKKGQIIGAFVTVRHAEARKIFEKALDAVDFTLSRNAISNNSVNFGVNEYIYFSGMKYDPKIGMLGLNVNATFARPGMRVERKKIKRGKVPRRHKMISNEELEEYLAKEFKVKFKGEES